MIILSDSALTTVERVVAAIQSYPFISEEIDFNDLAVTDEITRLINYWSSYVEQATNTRFGMKRYTEFYKGTSQPTLVLKHYPIKELISIEQITYDGEVVATLDIDKLMMMMNENDLERGILYIEPSLFQRFTSVGIVPEPFSQLRSYKIVYDAGYVLPQFEEDEPSDLPAALENLVIELARAQFIANTDATRANNLITLTEGNVQRMWAEPVEFKLTAPQEKILSLFKRKGL